jgi:Exonuclease III
MAMSPRSGSAVTDLLSSRFQRRVLLRIACALASAVQALSAAPSISTDKTSYAADESIRVSFAGGPASATDWVGIYPEGTVPSGDPPSLMWFYTNGTQQPGNGRSEGTLTFPPGLGSGRYAAWFLASDGYSVLAGPAVFEVAAEVPAWRVDAIRLRHAVVGNAYSGRIRAYASAPSLRRFQKVSGPAWLQVNADGNVSGTPGPGDVGINTFQIRLETFKPGMPAEVPLTIEVFPVGQEHVPELTVMSFNGWHEWNSVVNGFEKAVYAIVRSGADIIGLQESSPNRAQQMADELGWFRVPTGTGTAQMISKYPIVATHSVGGIESGRVVGATIRLAQNPQRQVVMFNTHLDYQFYGPYAAYENGATEASVLAENNRSQRVAQITAVLAGMAQAIANADVNPVFLTGDFNAPSHLDWTAATAEQHGGVGPVAWPESLRVVQAGLVDSFRAMHPDPVLEPGNSWSTIHKGTEPQDRIDFVYHRGKALHPVSSELYATEVQTTVGSWTTSPDPKGAVAGNTWPSDHFAVKTTYRLDPVDSDNNSLGDAWERRWFQRLGNDPGDDPNFDGVNNRRSMLLAVSPTIYEPPIRSVDPGSPNRVTVSLSDQAWGRGYRVERSVDLKQWTPLWQFDDDVFFSSPAIVGVSRIRSGEWLIQIQDNSDAPFVFYRTRLLSE